MKIRFLVAVVLAFALPSRSQALSVSIDWADTVSSSGAVLNPSNALGTPDTLAANLIAGPPPGLVTASFFGSASAYEANSLASLLGIDPSLLLSAEFLALERNPDGGDNPFGFESSRWHFEDGLGVVDVDWTEGGAAAGPIVAAGTIQGADYALFFGLPPNDDLDLAFLLFDLPLDVTAPSFSATVTARPNEIAPGVFTGTPDLDALGPLTPVPVPEPSTCLLLGAALLGIILRLKG